MSVVLDCSATTACVPGGRKLPGRFPGKKAREIHVEELQLRMRRPAHFFHKTIIVDCRSYEEFRVSTIKGAIHISRLEERMVVDRKDYVREEMSELVEEIICVDTIGLRGAHLALDLQDRTLYYPRISNLKVRMIHCGSHQRGKQRQCALIFIVCWRETYAFVCVCVCVCPFFIRTPRDAYSADREVWSTGRTSAGRCTSRCLRSSCSSMTLSQTMKIGARRIESTWWRIVGSFRGRV